MDKDSAPGGSLEIWVPDGLKICQMIVDHSLGTKNDGFRDGWLLHNPDQNPFLWASGRLFYGARDDYPSWHKAVFTATYLNQLFESLGLCDIHQMSPEDFRGKWPIMVGSISVSKV